MVKSVKVTRKIGKYSLTLVSPSISTIPEYEAKLGDLEERFTRLSDGFVISDSPFVVGITISKYKDLRALGGVKEGVRLSVVRKLNDCSVNTCRIVTRENFDAKFVECVDLLWDEMGLTPKQKITYSAHIELQKDFFRIICANILADIGE